MVVAAALNARFVTLPPMARVRLSRIGGPDCPVNFPLQLGPKAYAVSADRVAICISGRRAVRERLLIDDRTVQDSEREPDQAGLGQLRSRGDCGLFDTQRVDGGCLLGVSVSAGIAEKRFGRDQAGVFPPGLPCGVAVRFESWRSFQSLMKIGREPPAPGATLALEASHYLRQ